MMPRLDPILEARLMHDRREAFCLAQAANIALPEARRRLVEARWQARDAQRAKCGTRARDRAAQPVTPASAPTTIDVSDEGLRWFQR